MICYPRSLGVRSRRKRLLELKHIWPKVSHLRRLLGASDVFPWSRPYFSSFGPLPEIKTWFRVPYLTGRWLLLPGTGWDEHIPLSWWARREKEAAATTKRKQNCFSCPWFVSSSFWVESPGKHMIVSMNNAPVPWSARMIVSSCPSKISWFN